MKYFVLGFMGSGKSHTGKLLADHLSLPFFDLDELISEKVGKSITQIFADQGEKAFRVIERQCLESCLEMEKAVISVGGGTPCFFDNIQFMNKNGTTIFLRTPAKLLASRLVNERAHRPLIEKLEGAELTNYIEEKLTERTPFYEQAHLVYFQEKDNQDIVSELLEHI